MGEALVSRRGGGSSNVIILDASIRPSSTFEITIYVPKTLIPERGTGKWLNISAITSIGLVYAKVDHVSGYGDDGYSFTSGKVIPSNSYQALVQYTPYEIVNGKVKFYMSTTAMSVGADPVVFACTAVVA